LVLAWPGIPGLVLEKCPSFSTPIAGGVQAPSMPITGCQFHRAASLLGVHHWSNPPARPCTRPEPNRLSRKNQDPPERSKNLLRPSLLERGRICVPALDKATVTAQLPVNPFPTLLEIHPL
jgi:hypothetical protein